MEKICIVKRRKVSYERAPEAFAGSPQGADQSAPLQVVSISLTPEQADAVRSNGRFRELCHGEASQIIFNLHLAGEALPKMITPKEVGEILHVSRHTVSKLVSTGAVKSYKIGRLRRFSGQDIIDYLGRSAAVDYPVPAHVEVFIAPGQEARPMYD